MNPLHTPSAPAADRRVRLGFAAASLCTTLLLFQGVAMLASPSIEPQALLAGAAQPAHATAPAPGSVDNWKQSTVAQAGARPVGPGRSPTTVR